MKINMSRSQRREVGIGHLYKPLHVNCVYVQSQIIMPETNTGQSNLLLSIRTIHTHTILVFGIVTESIKSRTRTRQGSTKWIRKDRTIC